MLKSAKQKGSRLERKFASMLREVDKGAKRMPLSGADWALKSDIYTKLPYSFEVKNQEKIKIWQWWEQCQADARMKTPVLVFSGNRRPVMVCLKADDFIAILKEIYDN